MKDPRDYSDEAGPRKGVAERFPITWKHVIDKELLNINELEHVLMRHWIYPMSQYRKSRATFSGLASR